MWECFYAGKAVVKILKPPQPRGSHNRTCLGSNEVHEAVRNAEILSRKPMAKHSLAHKVRPLLQPEQSSTTPCKNESNDNGNQRRRIKFKNGSKEKQKKTTKTPIEQEPQEPGVWVYSCLEGCWKTSTKASSIGRHENSCELFNQ